MYGVAALEYAFPLKEVVADEPLAIEAVVCVPYDTELAAYLKVLNKYAGASAVPDFCTCGSELITSPIQSALEVLKETVADKLVTLFAPKLLHLFCCYKQLIFLVAPNFV